MGSGGILFWVWDGNDSTRTNAGLTRETMGEFLTADWRGLARTFVLGWGGIFSRGLVRILFCEGEGEFISRRFTQIYADFVLGVGEVEPVALELRFRAGALEGDGMWICFG